MENCLTTFKQNNDEEPMWFDRPCNESDGTSDDDGDRTADVNNESDKQVVVVNDKARNSTDANERVAVNDESNKVSCHFILSLCNCTLSLICISFMNLLKLSSDLKLFASLLRSSTSRIIFELSQCAVSTKLYLIRLIQDCMKASNDTASIVQNIRLLHVVGHYSIFSLGTFIFFLVILNSLDCNDNADDWLG